MLSKSGADPTAKTINTVTSVVYRNGSLRAAASGPTRKQFNCKMRTGESIGRGRLAAGSPNNSPGFESAPLTGSGLLATAAGSPRSAMQPAA